MRLGDMGRQSAVTQAQDKKHVISGKTFDYREPLKGLGCFWNPDTKHWSTDDLKVASAAALMIGGKWETQNAGSTPMAQGAGGDARRGDPTNVYQAPPPPSEPSPTPPSPTPDQSRPEPATKDDIEPQNDPQDEESESGMAGIKSPPNLALEEAQHPARDVDSLTHREAVEVLRALKDERGTKVGDYARQTLPEKQARIMAAVPDPEERSSLIERVVGGKPATTPASTQTQLPAAKTPKAGRIGPDGAKVLLESRYDRESQLADDDDEQDALDNEFSRRQAKAIREAIDQAEPQLDEDRIREIAREEDAEAPLNRTQSQEVADILSDFNDKASQKIDDSIKAYGQSLEKDINDLLEKAPQAGRKITLELKTPASIQVTDISHVHYLATKVCALVSVGQPVYMYGKPGVGKSTLAEQVAQMLGRKFGGALSLTSGVTESQLIGKTALNLVGGKHEYLSTPLVESVIHGWNYHLDELDAADPNCMLAINTLVANNYMYVEARMLAGLEPRIDRHPECGITGGGNTLMLGATGQMAGRQAQDAASVDRWFIVEMGYDENIVARMIGANPNPQRIKPVWKPDTTPFTENERNAWFNWWHEMGEYCEAKFKNSRTWSPRVLSRIVAARSVGITPRETLQHILAGWKVDDLKNAGALAQVPQFAD